ncbi:DUF4294 domain-containing protein [Apibacter sp. HY039]|uniref:DUF4294 domain-containing protein n=1 Tax=Apibacter sp. HY039 TaxID=2501476 RepID=UPI000FEB7F83|nr:DUF4294 domain-containing protein [Apibacter sp. HY039]
MKLTVLIKVFFLFIFSLYKAQEVLPLSENQDSISNYSFDPEKIIKEEATDFKSYEDSISIDLKLINVSSLPKFNNQLDRYQYNRLKKKVYNLYPYLELAVKEYNNLQDSIKLDNNSSDFKKYIKKRQKELSEKYEIQLKKLTKSEGKIFSKLMYRSTGKSVYDIIKELKNGWSAFWWNAKAGAFDIDLKEPFDPYHIRDDAYVESILIRAYEFGDLKPIVGSKNQIQ